MLSCMTLQRVVQGKKILDGDFSSIAIQHGACFSEEWTRDMWQQHLANSRPLIKTCHAAINKPEYVEECIQGSKKDDSYTFPAQVRIVNECRSYEDAEGCHSMSSRALSWFAIQVAYGVVREDDIGIASSLYSNWVKIAAWSQGRNDLSLQLFRAAVALEPPAGRSVPSLVSYLVGWTQFVQSYLLERESEVSRALASHRLVQLKVLEVISLLRQHLAGEKEERREGDILYRDKYQAVLETMTFIYNEAFSPLKPSNVLTLPVDGTPSAFHMELALGETSLRQWLASTVSTGISNYTGTSWPEWYRDTVGPAVRAADVTTDGTKTTHGTDTNPTSTARPPAAGRGPTRPRTYCIEFCPTRCCRSVTADDLEVLIDDLPRESHTPDISAVVQGSFGRLGNLRLLAESWTGPLVVILYVSVSDDNAFLHARGLVDSLRDELARPGSWAAGRGFVAVYVHDVRPSAVAPGAIAATNRLGILEQSHEWPPTALNLTRPVYPVNALRNLGVDLARTRWVFPLDIDFLPSEHMYESLSQFLQKIHKAAEEKGNPSWTAQVLRTAFVVPSFEALACKSQEAQEIEGSAARGHAHSARDGSKTSSVPAGVDLPRNKHELIGLLLRGTAKPFQANLTNLLYNVSFSSHGDRLEGRVAMRPHIQPAAMLDPTCNFNQTTDMTPVCGLFNVRRTDYRRWLGISPGCLLPEALRPEGTANKDGFPQGPEEDRHRFFVVPTGQPPDTDTSSYEPYVIVARGPYLPRYHEPICGRDKDKISFVQALRVLGFRFAVLCDEFITHIPHDSAATNVVRSLTGHALLEDYVAKLRTLYGAP
eukprot:Rmarinus@m.1654